jgi:hypothetical protein
MSGLFAGQAGQFVPINPNEWNGLVALSNVSVATVTGSENIECDPIFGNVVVTLQPNLTGLTNITTGALSCGGVEYPEAVGEAGQVLTLSTPTTAVWGAGGGGGGSVDSVTGSENIECSPTTGAVTVTLQSNLTNLTNVTTGALSCGGVEYPETTGSTGQVLVLSNPTTAVWGAAGSGGVVDSVNAGTNIAVDSTDPANPVVSLSDPVLLSAGTVTTLDTTTLQIGGVGGYTMPAQISSTPGYVLGVLGGELQFIPQTGSGGGAVDSVTGGSNITVDNTDPANPAVSMSEIVAGLTSLNTAALVVGTNSVGQSAYQFPPFVTEAQAGYLLSYATGADLAFIPPPTSSGIQSITGSANIDVTAAPAVDVTVTLADSVSITTLTAQQITINGTPSATTDSITVGYFAENVPVITGGSNITVTGDSVALDNNITLNQVTAEGGVVIGNSGAGTQYQFPIEIGTNGQVLTVDSQNNTLVFASAGGSGSVESVSSGANISIDNGDPANPIVNLSGSLSALTLVDTAGLIVGTTSGGNVAYEFPPYADPSMAGYCLAYNGSSSLTFVPNSAGVETVTAGGANIVVNSTDPANPVISLSDVLTDLTSILVADLAIGVNNSSYLLPSTQGAAGSVIQSNGDGTTSFVNIDLYAGNSSSQLTIAVADNLTMTVAPLNLSYISGMPVIVAWTAQAGYYMDGIVQSYNPGTGVMVFNCTSVVGSGTASSWLVNIGGASANFVASVGAGTNISVTGTQTLPVVNLADEIDLTSVTTTDLTINGLEFPTPTIPSTFLNFNGSVLSWDAQAQSGLYSNTIYVNDNVNDIQTAITAATTGTAIYMSAGSYSGGQVTMTGKSNLNIICPFGVGTVCELASRGMTINNTNTAIAISNLQFGASSNLSASSGKYERCNFTGTATYTFGTGTSGFIILQNCDFASTTTVVVDATFASAIYFINTNFGGATLSFLQASAVQVIIENCVGLPSFTIPKCTILAYNALVNGSSQANATNVVTANLSVAGLNYPTPTTASTVLGYNGAGLAWVAQSGGGSTVVEAGDASVSVTAITGGYSIIANTAYAGHFNYNTVAQMTALFAQSPLAYALLNLAPINYTVSATLDAWSDLTLLCNTGQTNFIESVTMNACGGINLQSLSFSSDVILTNCSGTITFENCSFNTAGLLQISITNSGAIIFDNCDFTAGYTIGDETTGHSMAITFQSCGFDSDIVFTQVTGHSTFLNCTSVPTAANVVNNVLVSSTLQTDSVSTVSTANVTQSITIGDYQMPSASSTAGYILQTNGTLQPASWVKPQVQFINTYVGLVAQLGLIGTSPYEVINFAPNMADSAPAFIDIEFTNNLTFVSQAMTVLACGFNFTSIGGFIARNIYFNGNITFPYADVSIGSIIFESCQFNALTFVINGIAGGDIQFINCGFSNCTIEMVATDVTTTFSNCNFNFQNLAPPNQCNFTYGSGASVPIMNNCYSVPSVTIAETTDGLRWTSDMVFEAKNGSDVVCGSYTIPVKIALSNQIVTISLDFAGSTVADFAITGACDNNFTSTTNLPAQFRPAQYTYFGTTNGYKLNEINSSLGASYKYDWVITPGGQIYCATQGGQTYSEAFMYPPSIYNLISASNTDYYNMYMANLSGSYVI